MLSGVELLLKFMLINNTLFLTNFVIFLLIVLTYIVYLVFFIATKQRANLIKNIMWQSELVTNKIGYLIKQNKQLLILKRNSLLVNYLAKQDNGEKKLKLIANLQKYHNLMSLDNDVETNGVNIVDARSNIKCALMFLSVPLGFSCTALYLCFVASVPDVLFYDRFCDSMLALLISCGAFFLFYCRPIKTSTKYFKKLPTLTALKEFCTLYDEFDRMQDRYSQLYFLIVKLIMLSSFETLGIKRTRQLFELFLSQETLFFNSRRQGILDLKVKFEDDKDVQSLLNSKNVDVAELKELIRTYNRESDHFMLDLINQLLGELLKDAQIQKTISMRTGDLDKMDSATRLTYYENSAKAINELTNKDN